MHIECPACHLIFKEEPDMERCPRCHSILNPPPKCGECGGCRGCIIKKNCWDKKGQ